MDTVLDTQIKRFLKKVVLNTQKEIEHSILAALEAQQLHGDETLSIKMTLSLPEIDLHQQVSGFINLK